MTSCVVIECEAETISTKVNLNHKEEFLYDSIIECIITNSEERFIQGRAYKSITYDKLHAELEARGISIPVYKDGKSKVKSYTQTARMQLKQKGKINFNRDHLWMTGE